MVPGTYDGGILTVPVYSRYEAGKAAAIELALRNIRVNAVSPGALWSEILPPDHPGAAFEPKLAPLGRV